MSEAGLGSTISLRERSFSAAGVEERLPKWFFVSLALHLILIVAMFLAPMWPTSPRPAPEATVVDLVGGERIGAANFGTELTAPPKQAAKTREEPPAPVVKREEPPAPVVKKELKKEEPVKESKAKTKEIEKKPPPPEEKIPSKEKSKTEVVRNEPAKDVRKEPSKEEAKT